MTDRDWSDAHLVNAARDIHARPAFGYRFIADELPEKVVTAGENRVQRLCRDHGIWSVFSKKRELNRKPGPPVHHDLVERDFTATAPNELWLTDITEHPTVEGKLYRCAVKDVYSGRLWAIRGTPGEVIAGGRGVGERRTSTPPVRNGGAFRNMKQLSGPRSPRPKPPSQQKPGQSLLRPSQREWDDFISQLDKLLSENLRGVLRQRRHRNH